MDFDLQLSFVFGLFWFTLFIVSSLRNIIFLILKLTFTFVYSFILLGKLCRLKLLLR